MLRTVQSVRPGGRTGRTAGGYPSFFESKDGLWDMELGPDALGARQGPVGHCRLGSQKIQVHDFISLILYDIGNHVESV